MKTLVAAALIAAASQAAAPPRGEATRTLVIRAHQAETILSVGAPAVAGLQQLAYGDQLTLVIRDDATSRETVVTALVSDVRGTAPAPARARPAQGVEVVSVDPASRIVVVRDASGERQVVRVDARALAGYRELKPGDKVLLRWRFAANGEPEPVLDIVREPPAAAQRVSGKVPNGVPVQVLLVDPMAGTLTIRRDGDPDPLKGRQFVVSDTALAALKNVKPGDVVVLTAGTANDRVIAIDQRPDATR